MRNPVFRNLLTVSVIVLCLLLWQKSANAGGIPVGVYGTWGTAKNEIFQVAKDNNFGVVVSNDIQKTANMKMQCLYPFWLTKEIAQDDVAWKAFVANVKTVVSSNVNNPAVLGWYLADEPDWHQVPVERFKELRTVIRAIDKNKPLFTVLTMPDKWYRYLPYFDIIGIDPYIDTTSTYAGRETDKVQDWIKKVKENFAKLKMNKPIYVVLGAFDLRPKGIVTSAFRKPTAAEFNKMVSICLNQKVAGILVFSLYIAETSDYYAWKLPTDDPVLWNAVRSLPGLVK